MNYTRENNLLRGNQLLFVGCVFNADQLPGSPGSRIDCAHARARGGCGKEQAAADSLLHFSSLVAAEKV